MISQGTNAEWTSSTMPVVFTPAGTSEEKEAIGMTAVQAALHCFRAECSSLLRAPLDRINTRRSRTSWVLQLRLVCVLAGTLTALAGCETTQDLTVYNASGRDYGGLSVSLGDTKELIGPLKSRSAIRIRFRKGAESSYHFSDVAASGTSDLGSCGYSSGALPTSTVAYLVILPPSGSPECVPIRHPR